MRAATVARRVDAALVLRAAIVAVVVAALVYVEVSSRSGVLWRLTTFTYQANVVAAVFYLATLVRRDDGRAGTRGAVVLYLVVAGLVWITFLTERSAGYTPANTALHVVVPVLALADWLLVGRNQNQARWWHPAVWLIYPLAYLGLALLVLNGAGRRAPYYFLDPEVIGWAALLSNVATLAAGFAGLGLALVAAGRLAVRLRRVDAP